jgi:hypothetical protein
MCAAKVNAEWVAVWSCDDCPRPPIQTNLTWLLLKRGYQLKSQSRNDKSFNTCCRLDCLSSTSRRAQSHLQAQHSVTPERDMCLRRSQIRIGGLAACILALRATREKILQAAETDSHSPSATSLRCVPIEFRGDTFSQLCEQERERLTTRIVVDI